MAKADRHLCHGHTRAVALVGDLDEAGTVTRAEEGVRPELDHQEVPINHGGDLSPLDRVPPRIEVSPEPTWQATGLLERVPELRPVLDGDLRQVDGKLG